MLSFSTKSKIWEKLAEAKFKMERKPDFENESLRMWVIKLCNFFIAYRKKSIDFFYGLC
jgi:hypothetical protein